MYGLYKGNDIRVGDKIMVLKNKEVLTYPKNSNFGTDKNCDEKQKEDPKIVTQTLLETNPDDDQNEIKMEKYMNGSVFMVLEVS